MRHGVGDFVLTQSTTMMQMSSIKWSQLLPCAQVRQRTTIVEYWDLLRNGKD